MTILALDQSGKWFGAIARAAERVKRERCAIASQSKDRAQRVGSAVLRGAVEAAIGALRQPVWIAAVVAATEGINGGQGDAGCACREHSQVHLAALREATVQIREPNNGRIVASRQVCGG